MLVLQYVDELLRYRLLRTLVCKYIEQILKCAVKLLLSQWTLRVLVSDLV